MVVRAYLHRPITGVDQYQFQRAAAGIDLDLALGKVDHAAFAGLADIEGFLRDHGGGQGGPRPFYGHHVAPSGFGGRREAGAA
jgi:hypothetical protein